MTEISDFGLIVLLVSAGVFLAVLGMRLADRIFVPNAAIFLVAAGILAATVDALGDVLSIKTVERIGVIALIVILFDGGLHIGLSRFRRDSRVGRPRDLRDRRRPRHPGRVLPARFLVDCIRADRSCDSAD